MKKLLRLILAAGALLLAAGCGDEADDFADRFAAAMCKYEFECQDRTEYESVEGCEEAFAADWETEVIAERAFGSEFDSACAEQRVGKLADKASCSDETSDELSTNECATCKTWFGTAGLGDSCIAHADCSQGLICYPYQNTTSDPFNICSDPCGGFQ